MLQAVPGLVCALTGMLPNVTLARALAFGGGVLLTLGLTIAINPLTLY